MKELMAAKRTDADRRANQARRMAVIIGIYHRLLGRSKWTPKLLAEEFEISEATLYRYLKVLEAAGVAYYFDKDYGAYRLLHDQRMPIPNLTPDELLAQGVAASVMQEPGLSPGKQVREVAAKISASQRDERSKILEDAQRLIQVLDLKLADHSKHGDMIRTAQWALVEGKQLAGTYESPYQSKPVKLRLHPYRLTLIQQAWYLIARSSEHDLPRTHRLHRFKSLKMLDDASVVPADFNLKAFFGNAWAVYRGNKTYDIELRFTKDAAAIVTETQWHATQKVKPLSDGSVLLSFKVDGLDEILWWVIGWAGRVEVRKPIELRMMMVEQIKKAIELNPLTEET
jgi:predicted DNA-binding transcriptional regulator YafY